MTRRGATSNVETVRVDEVRGIRVRRGEPDEHPVTRQNPDAADRATRDCFVYRHRWRPNDLLMWDNLRTMHRVTPYDIACRARIMHGTTIEGGCADVECRVGRVTH